MLAHLHLDRDGRRLKAVGAREARVVIDGLSYPITPAGLDVLLEDAQARRTFTSAALHFIDFARLWRFRDLERGKVSLLGEDLWPSQVEFCRIAAEQPWVFYLKARKLGLSTMSVAYAGWVARFSPVESARVHLLSRRDDAAIDLAAAVHFGLDALPEYLRLPIQDTRHRLTLDAGGTDVRVVEAYPTSRDTAREQTAQHVLVDELAAMLDPARVWQAVEPSVAPEGSLHVVTTGQGPLNFASILWQRSVSGTSALHPCFIPADQRPDRTQAWLGGKKKEMDATHFAREYPMEPADALAGSGPVMFSAADLDACTRYARGCGPAKEGHRYITGWDIGTEDASVGIVLDVTEPVFDVVGYVYLRPATYPSIQRAIEKLHAEFPGPTVIESNAAGAAVRANLNIREEELLGFATTAPSKARIISQLAIFVQDQAITWSPQDCPELDQEMRTYRADDKALRQDAVMSLAITLDHVRQASRGGPGWQVWRI